MYIGLYVIVVGCVEPIDVGPEIGLGSQFEGTLVIEANITNTTNNQRVFLSRMQAVESDSTVNVSEDRLFNVNTPIILRNGLAPNFESNANIEVRSDEGEVFVFQEIAPGTYESEDAFGARPGIGYQLFVTTMDGEDYESDVMQVPMSSSIDQIYAERITNDQGQEGMAIFVDASFAETGDKLLRYSFEETYKIIAPRWTPVEFEIIRENLEFTEDGSPLYPDVTTVPRAREEHICFNTDFSAGEILVNANILEGTISERNLVRFIPRDNPIISHRYSILVYQFNVTPESFEFYERLRAFSQSESLFSQIQPGSLEGNVFDIDGTTAVIGYFDVSSQVSQRLFFNYVDFFPGEPLPPYFGDINCDRLLSPPLPNPLRDGPPSPDGGCPFSLVDRINFGLVEYVAVNQAPGICEGPYFVTPTICGDCNIVGSNIVPEFWEE